MRWGKLFVASNKHRLSGLVGGLIVLVLIVGIFATSQFRAFELTNPTSTDQTPLDPQTTDGSGPTPDEIATQNKIRVDLTDQELSYLNGLTSSNFENHNSDLDIEIDNKTYQAEQAWLNSRSTSGEPVADIPGQIPVGESLHNQVVYYSQTLAQPAQIASPPLSSQILQQQPVCVPNNNLTFLYKDQGFSNAFVGVLDKIVAEDVPKLKTIYGPPFDSTKVQFLKTNGSYSTYNWTTNTIGIAQHTWSIDLTIPGNVDYVRSEIIHEIAHAFRQKIPPYDRRFEEGSADAASHLVVPPSPPYPPKDLGVPYYSVINYSRSLNSALFSDLVIGSTFDYAYMYSVPQNMYGKLLLEKPDAFVQINCSLYKKYWGVLPHWPISRDQFIAVIQDAFAGAQVEGLAINDWIKNQRIFTNDAPFPGRSIVPAASTNIPNLTLYSTNFDGRSIQTESKFTVSVQIFNAISSQSFQTLTCAADGISIDFETCLKKPTTAAYHNPGTYLGPTRITITPLRNSPSEQIWTYTFRTNMSYTATDPAKTYLILTPVLAKSIKDTTTTVINLDTRQQENVTVKNSLLTGATFIFNTRGRLVIGLPCPGVNFANTFQSNKTLTNADANFVIDNSKCQY